MENLGKFYIDGKWVTPNSKQSMPVINPATEEEIGTVILGNNDDVDIAVKAANIAFDSFSKTTKEDRLKLLKRIHEVTSDRFEDLAQAMSKEMGDRSMNAKAKIGTTPIMANTISTVLGSYLSTNLPHQREKNAAERRVAA